MNRKYLKKIINDNSRYSNLSKSKLIEKLAKDLGKSKNTVYNILAHQLPKEEDLDRLDELLDIDFNLLFKKG